MGFRPDALACHPELSGVAVSKSRQRPYLGEGGSPTRDRYCRMVSRTLVIVLLTLLLGQSIAAAWADTVAEPSPPVMFLILGFNEDGSLSQPARRAAADRVLADELGVAVVPLLHPEQLLCVKRDCLESLIGHFPGVDYLLGGSITSHPDSQRHVLRVWILKAAPASEDQAGGLPRYAEAVCESCGGSELLAKLTDTLTNLVQSQVRGEGGAPRMPGPSQSLKTNQPYCRNNGGWSFGRAFLLGASSGVLAAGLTAGSVLATSQVTLSLSDGSGKSVSSQPLTFDRLEYTTVGFSAAGAGALGAILSLVSGSRPREAGATTCSSAGRFTAGRGGAAGAFSGLLLSGLITSTALSISNGRMCVGGSPQIVCDFTTPTGVSWGLTGAWALGLTLTLAWPGSLQSKSL